MTKDRPLPKATIEYLQHGAAQGEKNRAIFNAACQFRDAGYSQMEAEAEIVPRAIADRPAGTNSNAIRGEAERAIRSAYSRASRSPIKTRQEMGRAEDFARKNPWHSEPEPEPEIPRGREKVPLDWDEIKVWHQRVAHLKVDRKFLADRSPVHPGSIDSAEAFIDSIFYPKECVIIQTRFQSKCDFIRWVGKKTFRVSSTPGDYTKKEATPPQGAADGMWFLANPVDGKWHPQAGTTRDGRPNMSRRNIDSVTSFRYLVLESDDLTEEQWLPILVQVSLPIVAIYTRAGKSIHALCRLDARSHDEWDEWANWIGNKLVPLGADPGSLSSVRLTRLPFCKRFSKGKWQELLYLNPQAKEPIYLQYPIERRETSGR